MLELLAQESGGGSSLVAFLPLLVMGGIFYFLLIRPQQRRARAQRELLSSVEVGDEVVTTAGVFGLVTDIDDEDDIVTVEIAPGTRVRMLRVGHRAHRRRRDPRGRCARRPGRAVRPGVSGS